MALVGLALGLPSETRPDSSPTDWDRLLALADAHRVLPLLHSGLKAAPEVSVPADVSARLTLQANILWRRSLILSQQLACLSRLLSSYEIPMAAMKGPGLAAQAYGPGVARAMRDLDILIRPEDFRRAQAVLESGGFVCEMPVSRLTRPLQDLYLRSATHITFQHAALGYLLEVHLRPMQVPSLFPVSTETLLADARPVALGGGDVPVLAPPHHLLYVAAHGAKHGWWRLLWLADFAAFQREAPDSLVLGDLGLQRVLSAAAALCHLCFGSPLLAQAGSPDASEHSVRALVAHGCRCLERGRPPVSYAEKWDELFQLIRLRPEAAYRWDVARLYWDLTPADLASLCDLPCFSAARLLPPGVLTGLAPMLRPALWTVRRMLPRTALKSIPGK